MKASVDLWTNLARPVGLTAFGLGLGWTLYLLVRLPRAPRPVLGYRGMQRKRALDHHELFRAVEPGMRAIAGWLEGVPGTLWRRWIERQVQWAGDFMGLSAQEVLSLSLLSTLATGGAGALWVAWAEWSPLWIAVACIVGGTLPFLSLRNERKRRFQDIQRGLPHAIDLASMCMSAGLDFPGSLRLLAQGERSSKDALREEFRRILEELELGHTRSDALGHFAARVPTEAVREFTSAVIQAEQKGTPIAEVLQIQARMLRMRRSVAAEEAAAKAAVMLLAPVAMLMACILIGLLGPFLITSAGF